MPPVAVNVTDGEVPFLQTVALPDTEVVGPSFTVTVTGEEVAWQPLASVTVTLKIPGAVTTIDDVVAPLLHSQAVPPAADKVTEPPEQKTVELDALIKGALTE